MSNELHTQNKPAIPVESSVFIDDQKFNTAQRIAKMLCSSQLVPQSYQGQNGMANCMIALEIANRIGASPLMIMQNLYIVHGRPAWSSQFLISCVNASGRFSPIRYKMTGEKGQDSYGCIAWAKDKTGEILESPEVTIGMAKSEGWYGKNGSKWKTMADLMLRYRSATLFARLYAPELTMGIKTDDEVIDIVPVGDTPAPSPIVPQTMAATILAQKAAQAEELPLATTSETTTEGAE